MHIVPRSNDMQMRRQRERRRPGGWRGRRPPARNPNHLPNGRALVPNSLFGTSSLVCGRALLLLALWLFPSAAPAQFNTLETPHLRLIYYGKLQSYIVPHVARSFENAFEFYQQHFHYRPSEKVTVLLHDFYDYGNAGAGVVPKNHITLGIAPSNYVFETSIANERINSTLNHELAHIVASDQASRGDRFFRAIFGGKVRVSAENPLSMIFGYLTTPRRYAPRWYHEGMAVFWETWMSGGLGRALGGYDEMVFRTLVQDSAAIYDVVGLESEGTTVDFQVSAVSYLYGTRFMSYLALRYGPESVVRWMARGDTSSAYFAAQFRRVYGRSLESVWREWIQEEREFQRQNLQTIRRYPLTRYRVLSRRALGSVSRAAFDANSRTLFAGVNYPGQIPHIAAIQIDTGELRKVLEVKGAALYSVCSLAYDSTTSTLFYTTDNNGWRDLRSVNLVTGKSRMLMKNVRVGDLVFDGARRCLWGVRHYNGISTLVRIPYPYNDWKQVYSWPYGRDIYDIDLSPDGRYLSAALAEISGRQTLILIDLQNLHGNGSMARTLFDFENSIPAGFVFSPDGRALYGASYYSGVSNIYRYDLQADSMALVTNTETGFFRPIPVSADSLIVFRYTSRGFIPVMISARGEASAAAIRFFGQEVVEKHPVVKQWKAGSPRRINLDSIATYRGRYRSLPNVRFTSAYPIVEGYKDRLALGWHFDLSGPIGLHSFSLTASYTPTEPRRKERFHANFSYSHMNWKFAARYNAADFYDLFGPTKVSRKGYSASLQYRKTLIYDRPKTLRYTVSVAGYGGLERLPDYQNVRASFDRFVTSYFNLTYRNMRASLGAVDYEKGWQWQLNGRANYVNGRLIPRIYGILDVGVPLRLHHSSAWLRTAAGRSFGERNEPFANFYFGGFGNNWVDHQHEKRYREYYSFPGIDLNAAGGISFVKGMLEWNLPPLRFRKLGWAWLYSNWMRTALFAGGLVTDVDAASRRRTRWNAGVQIDFRMIGLSHHSSTLSFGFAVAGGRGRSTSREWMVSLKIL